MVRGGVEKSPHCGIPVEMICPLETSWLSGQNAGVPRLRGFAASLGMTLLTRCEHVAFVQNDDFYSFRMTTSNDPTEDFDESSDEDRFLDCFFNVWLNLQLQ
jgi:hypothetical protein